MRLHLTLIIVAISLNVSAQQELRKTKTMIGFELGPMIPLGPSNGLPSFMPPHNTQFSFAPVFSYFLKNNLGFTVTMQIMPEESYIKKNDFERWDQQHYTKDGLYKQQGYIYYSNQSSVEIAAMGGLSYKIESRRWLFIPRILVGVISTANHSYNTIYKLKDSHELYEVSFGPDNNKVDNTDFCIQGGFNSYFRIKKFFSVSLGAMLHHQNTQPSYSYQNTLQPSGKIYLEEYNWNKPRFSARLSAGVSFTFPHRRR